MFVLDFPDDLFDEVLEGDEPGRASELVDDGLGIAYDPTSPEALSQAMAEIRHRDIQSLSAGARARAELLDWRAIAARVASIYRNEAPE